MGQKWSEVERMLSNAGFIIVGHGKHLMWRKGQVTFTTHPGSKPDHREIRHARSAIRRAAEGRKMG